MSNDARRQIAELLIKSQAWDNFMAIKFPTVKRYGGEGAESLVAFYWQLLRNSVQGKNKFLCWISKNGWDRIVVIERMPLIHLGDDLESLKDIWFVCAALFVSLLVFVHVGLCVTRISFISNQFPT